MDTYSGRIEALDVGLFDAVPSQTSTGDRRSLLAIQRVTAQKHGEFSYLEIGSHLGGSIQPYLLDDRCTKIYSIDPRPTQQQDDRAAGFVYAYPDNSSARMLGLLKDIGHGDISKIECIDSAASEVDPARIRNVPEILFIDGEHTKTAVLSDFRFCEQVASSSGTIVFHDFNIIYSAITEVCRHLDQKNRDYVPLKLEDNVFAVFFDPDKIQRDPYLAAMHRKHRHLLPLFFLSARLKRILPEPALRAIRAIRNRLRKRAERKASPWHTSRNA
jgi:hypothetical protein